MNPTGFLSNRYPTTFRFSSHWPHCWFVESLFTQTLIIISAGAWLTVSPLAHTLGFVTLSPLYRQLLAIMLLCYMILTQMVKTWFFRRFGDRSYGSDF